MIIDTHAHYNLPPFVNKWQTHWQKSQLEGITRSVIVGVDLATSQQAQNIAQQDKNLFAAVGFHPTEWNQAKENDLTQVDQLETLLQAPAAQIVAIGETGLDYFHFDDTINIEQATSLQQAAFRQHIQLAKKFQLPLIIHVRDKAEQAYSDVLQILSAENYTGIFILHCVSGPLSYISQAAEMGAYFGVAGNVTYKSADQIRLIVKSVPATQLLSETDAPFLPPVPFRGQTCEPWMITKTVTFLEQEQGIPAEQLWQNADRAFNLTSL